MKIAIVSLTSLCLFLGSCGSSADIDTMVEEYCACNDHGDFAATDSCRAGWRTKYAEAEGSEEEKKELEERTKECDLEALDKMFEDAQSEQ